MKYSLARIFHNLYHNWLAYIIIMINFMLGAGFFIICMNFKMTSSRLLIESKQQSTERVIPVTQWGAWDINEKDYSISYDTYLKLSTDEKYANDTAMLFAQGFSASAFLLEQEEAVTNWVYFMNDNLFDYLYGFTRREDRVYLGNTAYRNLLTAGDIVKKGDGTGIIFFPFEAYIDGEFLIINGKIYSYEMVTPLEKNTIMPGFSGSSGYNMEEVIILPIEDAFVPETPYPEITITTRSILFFRYLHDEWKEDAVAQQLRELNAANEKVTFQVEDEYLGLKRRMEDYSYDMDRWLIVSVSIMMLSGIGCIGLMFLLLNGRRHFIAVSIAYGSTLWRIGAETVMEIFIVLLSGGMLGILISPALKKCIIYQEELQLNVWGVISVILMAFVFSVVAVLMGMHEIKVKDVAITLKNE